MNGTDTPISLSWLGDIIDGAELAQAGAIAWAMVRCFQCPAGTEARVWVEDLGTRGFTLFLMARAPGGQPKILGEAALPRGGLSEAELEHLMAELDGASIDTTPQAVA